MNQITVWLIWALVIGAISIVSSMLTNMAKKAVFG